MQFQGYCSIPDPGVYVVHGGRYHKSLDAMLCKDVVVTSAKGSVKRRRQSLLHDSPAIGSGRVAVSWRFISDDIDGICPDKRCTERGCLFFKCRFVLLQKCQCAFVLQAADLTLYRAGF